jgi:hypothetical protein
MDGSFAAGESVFRDPATQKSAHYGISKSGEVHQYVEENDTAFHAGIVVNPTWPLLNPRVNPNFYTIGIEHEGRPDDIWPDAQTSASAALIGEIAARWNIPLDDSHVIRHHQIRASKTCPGNWLQIAALLNRVPVASAPVVLPSANLPGNENDSGASAQAAVPASPVLASTIAGSMVVRTIRKLNLRRAKPSTRAEVLRLIPAHIAIVAVKVVTGEQVDGNANWYADVQGNYFWAGATDRPHPSLPEADRARASVIGQ